MVRRWLVRRLGVEHRLACAARPLVRVPAWLRGAARRDARVGGAAVTTVKVGDEDQRDLEATRLRARSDRAVDPLERARTRRDRAACRSQRVSARDDGRIRRLRLACGRPPSAFTGRDGSRFTEEVYETVRKEAPWRAESRLHRPRSRRAVAAYALVWLDEPNQVGELEPVGVRPESSSGEGSDAPSCLHALAPPAGRRREHGDHRLARRRRLLRAAHALRIDRVRELWRDLVYSR